MIYRKINTPLQYTFCSMEFFYNLTSYFQLFTITTWQGCILVLRLIFLPPPLFRIIFFPLTHDLKTGVFYRFLKPAQTSKKFAAAGGFFGF